MQASVHFFENSVESKKRLRKRITEASTKTITRCIEKLYKNEGIQFTTIYDPKKIKKFLELVF